MESLKPNEQRGRIAVILIWIVLATEVLSLISGYLQYNLLQDVANGVELSETEADANDIREQIAGVLYLIVSIISAITFILWFRRAYYNLHQKVDDLTYTEGWAAGCWFLPILCLYRPYQIMKEMYSKTDTLLTSKGIDTNRKLDTKLLISWWALWIISAIIGQISFRTSLHAETVTELINTTLVSIVANIVGIPLGLVTIQVVQRYANVESYLNSDSPIDPYLNLVDPEDV